MCYTVFTLQSLSLFIVKTKERRYSKIYIPLLFRKYLQQITFFENEMLHEIQEEIGLPSIVAPGRRSWEIFLISSEEEMNKTLKKLKNKVQDCKSELIEKMDLGEMILFKLTKKINKKTAKQIRIWFSLENCPPKLLHLRQNRILFGKKLLKIFVNEMGYLICFLLPNGKYFAVSFADERNESFFWPEKM